MQIVLAVVVSLIVWGLTSLFLFTDRELVLSVALALAGGLIAVLIMRALTKERAIPPSKTLHLIVAAVGAAIVSFLGSIFIVNDCPNPVTLTIVCEEDEVTVVPPDPICINPGVTVTWVVQAPAEAKVKIHEFKRAWQGQPVWDAVPLDEVEYDGGPGSQLVGTARPNHKGSFKYTVSCKLKGGRTNKLDPIIDIPKP